MLSSARDGSKDKPTVQRYRPPSLRQNASARGPSHGSVEGPASSATPAEERTPRRAPSRETRPIYEPPRMRREREERERREKEQAERRAAEEAARREAAEAERQRQLDEARQAGKERTRVEAEQREGKERERREAAAEARRARDSEAQDGALPLGERQQLALVLVASSSGSEPLRPRDVSVDLEPAAQLVSPVDEHTALVAFGSAAAARQALRDERPRTFRLSSVTAEDVPDALRTAALALHVTPATRTPRGSRSTVATRLIASNLELTREAKADARNLAREKEGAARARGKARGDAERRRREAADAVWDEDDDAVAVS